MTHQQINEIEKIIGHKFNHKELLIQAYTRRSYTEENPGADNNEVLETLGDSIINMYVTHAIISKYRMNPAFFRGLKLEINEGVLSEMRREIVCGKNLANHAQRLGLANPDYIRMGNGDRQNKVFEQQSVQEDLLESIVGAVAMDLEGQYFGLNFPAKYLLDLIVHLLDLGNLDTSHRFTRYSGRALEHSPDIGVDNFNPINYLQELWKAGQIPMPVYRDEGGSEGRWTYSASIFEKGLSFSATVATKKEAKMHAAVKLYDEIKLNYKTNGEK